MFAVALLSLSTVVINHGANVVGVALTRVPYIGSCILQHGDEERQYITVGVHVLNGLHQAGTLPLPAVQFGLEIPAVAGPHRHDVAVQAMLVVAVGIQFGNERLVGALIGRLIIGKVLVDVVADDGDEHGIILVIAPKRLTYLTAHLFNTGLGKRHVTKVLADIHLDGVILKDQ